MGTMPVGRLLFSMAVPMMVSMLFQALYNVVDSIFVAKLSQDAMNAVSLAFPLQTLCIAFSGGTGVGMNALLSRSLGEKNQAGADRAANVGLFLTLCNFALFALIGWTLAGPFFRFQTDNPQIIAYGRDYVTVCIGCSIGLFFQMYNERLLQSTGRTNLSMITQIAGAATNIVLDPILIFGLLGFPRLEVAGAAIATVIGQLVGASIGFYLNLTRNPDVHLRRREIRPHAATIKEIYAVGVPSIIMQSIGSVMVFGMNKILISFTEAATAVFGAYFKLQSFIFMPIFGLNNAMVPIISYNYGAGKPERIKPVYRDCILTVLLIGVPMCALLYFFSRPLLGIYIAKDDPAYASVLASGMVRVTYMGMTYFVCGIMETCCGMVRGLGRSWMPMVVTIFGACVLRIIWIYTIFQTHHTLDVLYLSYPVSWVVTSAVHVLCFILIYRRMMARWNAHKEEENASY